MSSIERKPIIEQEVKFYYSNGLYKFFCQSTAKLFIILFGIIRFVVDPASVLKREQYASLVSCL